MQTARRIKVAVGNDGLPDYSRRAQETDAAIWGTRAAYIVVLMLLAMLQENYFILLLELTSLL